MSPPATPGLKASRERRFALMAAAVVAALAVSKLLIHLYAGRSYGYFVDELYYIACGKHMDWGYVDQPPLAPLVMWCVRHTLGQSLAAIRFLPAVVGACEVAVAGLIARDLGGERFAQGFAALATLTAPGVLGVDGFYSMNAFEPLFWMGCAWLLIRIVKSGRQRLWICFGALAGIGLENKYSMGIFGAGVVLGLLLTAQRRELASKWLWIGGAIAALLFLPNLLWNVQHHFPFVELQNNIHRSGRDVALSPLAFLGQEALAMHPLALPVWLAGLWFFFAAPAGKPFRALGWTWVFTAAVIAAVSPRVYYLFPAFPMLFAAGAVYWEGRFASVRMAWKMIWPAVLVVTGAMLAPTVIPILPPESFISYAEALHLQQPRIETHKLGPLPQIFADQFGWEEMARVVAKAYNGLPPTVRAKTAIFGQNYGQAGAIDLFGPRYGLPPAISGHQSYFFWGPRGYTGESMIVMDDRRERLEELFATVAKVGSVYHPYSMPYEHFNVYYCTGLKAPLAELWPKVKTWD
jgi:hypothetical protein